MTATLSPVIESGPLDSKGQARIQALAQDEVAVLAGPGLPVYVIEAGGEVPNSNFFTRLFRKDYNNYTIVTQAILTDTLVKTLPSTDARLEYDFLVTLEAKVISPANYLKDFRKDRTIISPIRLWLEGKMKAIISQHAPNQIKELRESLQNFATYVSGNRPLDSREREASIEIVNLGIDVSFSNDTKKLIEGDTIRGLIETYGPSILLDMAAVHPERAEAYRTLYRDRMNHPVEEFKVLREAADVASVIANGDPILEEKLRRNPALLATYTRVIEGVKSEKGPSFGPVVTEALLKPPEEPKRIADRRTEK